MKTKILIVEDEMLIAANISLDLSSMGYDVIGILPRAEEALLHIAQNKPDILLLDIQLKGKMNGIELAKKVKESDDIPIIFLTANSDEKHFDLAKEAKPHAFISKPFKKLDLQRAIQLVENRLKEDQIANSPQKPIAILEGYVFIRDNEKMIKLAIDEIEYIEAERNYCRIYTTTKEHLVVITMKEMESKLPSHPFVRIHRSYIVNLTHIVEVTSQNLTINGKTLPISKTSKEELLQRIRTI
ncbi:MAG: LytTR family transcriptional regulator DNA-binding domain-containing protein [Cytophagales bacterium]|nr:LytTR family transcriptional regulator DNA-binding domain-containing protein [Cytophagales bacterium]